MKKRTIFVLLGVVIVGVLGWTLYYFFKDDTDVVDASNIQGVAVCLPLLESATEASPDCVLGLQTDDEENTVFFGLETNSIDEEKMEEFDTGDLISVSGTLVPFSELKEGDRFLDYAVEGVIAADSLSVLTNNGQNVGEDIMASSTLHVMKGGDLQFEVPDDFGLAVTPEQLLVQSYIPPCGSSFDYCIYYKGNEYASTTFESAGLRMEERPGLAKESDGNEACLASPPEGYTNLTPTIDEGDGYSTSVFSPVMEAGAGHYAEGAVYRVAFGESCFEFETRIGQSQYENYEEGSIEKFTDGNKRDVEEMLVAILQSIRFTDKEESQVFDELPAKQKAR